MNDTTQTETPEMKKKRLATGRQKWQDVVDQLYHKIKITPGNRKSLAFLKQTTKDNLDKEIIRLILLGEAQIDVFNFYIQEATAAEASPNGQVAPHVEGPLGQPVT